MSDTRSISEKRRAGEKHGKPSGSASKPLPASSAAEAVAPAPGQRASVAPKPSPGAQASEEFVSNLLRSVQATGQVIAKIVEDKDKRQGAFTVASGMGDSGKLFAPIIQYWMNDPKAYAEAQAKLSEDMIDLWGRTYKRFLGEKVEPVIAPSGHDPRFSDKEWTENAFFDFLKQAYLLAGKWAEDMIHNAATVDAHTKHRAEFYLNQIVSALSPSNFPFTNPEVIRATVSTGAKNLAQGMTHLLEDLDHSGELLRTAGTCVPGVRFVFVISGERASARPMHRSSSIRHGLWVPVARRQHLNPNLARQIAQIFSGNINRYSRRTLTCAWAMLV